MILHVLYYCNNNGDYILKKADMSDNSQVIENTKEIVVTEAMIEAGVELLDDWLSRWITEMYKEGHTGFDKDVLASHMLGLSSQRFHQ